MRNYAYLSFAALALMLSACSAGGTAQPSPPDTPTAPPIINPEDPGLSPTPDYSQLEIITLLPKDAIPAIDDPNYLSVSEADQEYAPGETVLGVEFNGEARAYSVSHLSRHEIVNDTVGGVAISVTW